MNKVLYKVNNASILELSTHQWEICGRVGRTRYQPTERTESFTIIGLLVHSARSIKLTLILSIEFLCKCSNENIYHFFATFWDPPILFSVGFCFSLMLGSELRPFFTLRSKRKKIWGKIRKTKLRVNRKEKIFKGCFDNSLENYTVTRPYAGFRHPDQIAPDSIVREGTFVPPPC